MSTVPWLTVTMAIPAVGALLLAVIPGAGGASEAGAHARNLLAKRVALVVSLLTLAVTIAMIVSFKPGGPAFQFTQTYQWIPQFGIHYAVGVDGIGLVLIGMTAVLMPVVVLASWNDADPPPAADSAAAGAPATGGPGAAVPAAARPRHSVKTYFVWMLLLEAMVIGIFAATVGGTSGRMRRVQTGFVRSYALSMLVGAVLLVGALLLVRI